MHALLEFRDKCRKQGTTLLLSGGATLGLFHVGVVKALFRENLLPTVLSGSSAGSVVAATVGSRTPEEAHMQLLYAPYVPNRAEFLILANRRILADQMEFLRQHVSANSRIKRN